MSLKEPEKDLNLITRFFDLALSDEELIAFEKRLVKDSAFQKKFETYKEANAIVDTKYPDTKKTLRTEKWKKLLDTKETPTASKKTPWKWIGSIAAGFVLLFSIWQFSAISQGPDMDRQLAASWDKKVGLLEYRTTRSSAIDSLKQQIYVAYGAYQTKNYQTAITLLNNYKATSPYYDDALLIKALSYYQKENVPKALTLLKTLSENSNKKMVNTARWYIGLIYLEKGDKESAKQFLKLPEDKNQEIKLKEEL